MSSPRLEIHLDRLHHNALSLNRRLARQGIALTGVSKACLGMPAIIRTWAEAGISSIGESRVDTLEGLRSTGIALPLVLIRSPLVSQVERVVATGAISLNSELAVLRLLAAAAARQGRRHGVVLMVELGDLREGFLAEDLQEAAGQTLALSSLDLVGIGANLGCQHGVAPDDRNMAELSGLATAIEAHHGVSLKWVSGGNSCNLAWLAAGGSRGRINHLRIGEALLLGRDPLSRQPIPGLLTNAIGLVAEVIEAKRKPSKAWGRCGQTSFAAQPTQGSDRGVRSRALLAVGEQDVDCTGLTAPGDLRIIGASSDHLVIEDPAGALVVGQDVPFELNYSALLRAMTSPFVQRTCLGLN